MNSSDTWVEATRWLVELQTADRLEDIWEEFDEWFQASSAHRAAYAKARRHWRNLTGLPALPIRITPPETAIHRLGSGMRALAAVLLDHLELVLVVLLALMIACSSPISASASHLLIN